MTTSLLLMALAASLSARAVEPEPVRAEPAPMVQAAAEAPPVAAPGSAGPVADLPADAEVDGAPLAAPGDGDAAVLTPPADPDAAPPLAAPLPPAGPRPPVAADPLAPPSAADAPLDDADAPDPAATAPLDAAAEGPTAPPAPSEAPPAAPYDADLVHALDAARPARGWRQAVLLALLALLLRALSTRLRALRTRLAPQGVVPRLVDASRVALKVGALLSGSLALLALLAAAALPLVAVVVLAGAVGLGFAAREPLTDVLAGLTLLLEGRVRPRCQVRVGAHEGVVVSTGLRAATLRTASGATVSVPNRAFLHDAVFVAAGPWPRLVVQVAPDGRPAEARRLALRDAAVVCPWRAVGTPVEVLDGPDGPTGVALHLLDLRWSERAARQVRALAQG